MTARPELAYQMVLVQFIPKIAADERVNIGVVLFSARSEVAFRLSERYGRLSNLVPGFDGLAYRSLIRHLRRRITALVGAHTGQEQPALMRFEGGLERLLDLILTAGPFKCSQIRYGICGDLQQHADVLYDEFVSQWELSAGRERVDGNLLWERLQAINSFQTIARDLETSVRIRAPLYEYTFRAGWHNGSRQVVEPISLDYTRPADMVEEANKWAGRLDQLRRGNEFHLTAILTDPPLARGEAKYQQARAILESTPGVRQVFSQSQVGGFAELVRSDLLEHPRNVDAPL